MSNSLKPIIASVDGVPTGVSGVSVAPMSPGAGSPAKLVVTDGGANQDCSTQKSSPVASVGTLRAMEAYTAAVSQVAEGVSDETIQGLLGARKGFSCEEMRAPGHVSDYVSLADFSTVTGYRLYPMRTAEHYVLGDENIVRTESASLGSRPVRTLHQACKYVPVREPLLTRNKKGDLVEIRIEYKRDEHIDGVTHHVRKCSVQRLYIGHRDDGCSYEDRMYVRYIYANTSVSTLNTEVKSTETTAAEAEPAKTRFQRAGQSGTTDAPIRLVITEMQKAPSFMIAFNASRIVLYCLDDTVTEYRITSCKAIRSAEV
jgi:hypothetical protein